MKKLAVVVWLVLFSGVVFAVGYEPQRPQVDSKQLNSLISRAAYSAFIGDACNITHSTPDKIRKIINLIYSTTSTIEEQQQTTLFTKKKSDFASNAQTIGIWKRCYLEAGKTRVLVNNVGEELDNFYQATSSQLSDYNKQHAEWKRQLDQEQIEYERQLEYARRKAEVERQEKIKLYVLKIAEQLGKSVVLDAYKGGENIGVNLVSYEHFESESSYVLKVELNWNGKCAEDGTLSAHGLITTIKDNSKYWEYGKNFKWNPSWQSESLTQSLANSNSAMSILDAYSKAYTGNCYR